MSNVESSDSPDVSGEEVSVNDRLRLKKKLSAAKMARAEGREKSDDITVVNISNNPSARPYTYADPDPSDPVLIFDVDPGDPVHRF